MFGIVNENARVVAIADISSGACSVALMRFTCGGSSVILAQHRTELPLAERTHAQTQAQIIVALADAAHHVRTAHQAPIQALFVIARAPWVHSRVSQAREQFDRDTMITVDMLSALGRSISSADMDADDSATSFEKVIAHVELNGYPTRMPIGKRARMVNTAVLESSVDDDFKRAVEHALGVVFTGVLPLWRSHTRALLSLLAQIAPRFSSSHPHIDTRNCVVIDVSSTETSLYTIRKDVITEQKSIPFGDFSIVQKAAGVGLGEELFAILRAIENNTCSTQECERLSGALAAAEPEFLRILGGHLSAMAAPRRLPNTLFLIAHAALIPWLSQFFARIDFAQFTVTTMPFAVVPLTAEIMDYAITAEYSHTPTSVPRESTAPIATEDTSLAIACALVHTEMSRS